MPWQLCKGISFCEAEGKLVVFDAERDRYFALGGASAGALRHLVEDDVARSPAIHALASGGVIESAERVLRPIQPARATQPSSSAIEMRHGPRRVEVSQIAVVGWLVASTVLQLRFRSLSETLGRLADRKHRLAAPCACEQQTAAKIAQIYQTCRSTIPIGRVCLLDSLALLRFLLAPDRTANLVFGVTLNPFNAHCWVQAEDVVLSDRLDTALAHTPILVI